MKWRVRLSRNAVRSLRQMPARDRRRIDHAIIDMEEDPLVGDITPLKGKYQGSFRRRVGAWRILFTLHPEQEPKTVDINDILRRTSTTY